MNLEDALEIVSYKLALKLGEAAHDDPVLCSQTIRNALSDKESDTLRSIAAKEYMAATKMVNEHRKNFAKAQNERYLEENANEPGIQTTQSGLQYRVVKKGEGPTPSEEDTVVVDYEGSLTCGKRFDSSFERGEPSTFAVEKVIKGWQEGLQMMPKGSQFQFFIPGELAYGERGAGSDIPPHATLIFEVQLHDIVE
ncbi:MAG: FKBP-type peptidyl-prolyl cis-trans isomerase [Verrucomicrobiota bacterium]